ncbi:Uncharacterised protein [Mycobacteroides abscessus subsp. abscessus]|nr:Uncharacterised protein [Mycobacteroides abscessus subsp. abscessus]
MIRAVNTNTSFICFNKIPSISVRIAKFYLREFETVNFLQALAKTISQKQSAAECGCTRNHSMSH